MKPVEGDEKNVNIRWLPSGISEQSTINLTQETQNLLQPMILLEKINFYDGPTTIALPQKGRSLDYVYTLGRMEGKERDSELDITYPVRTEGVSRRHCKIYFNR